MIQRVRHIVYCTVVMPASQPGDCLQLELEMGKHGFHPRGEIERRAGSCVCSYVQEHALGTVAQLRDAACATLTNAVSLQAGNWRGYVQVCGNEGAWATLVPGKPPVFGVIEEN